MSLREKIRIIFREQDIGAVITAIGAVITAIVEGLKPTAISATAIQPKPPGPPKPPGILNNSKNALRWLADKAASTLPRIIGSIILLIFRVTVNVVGWLAQNLWPLLLTAGALVIAIVNKFNQRR